MKATKIILSLVVMGTLTLGFAQTDSAINETLTSNQEAMQNAKPEDRAELMNQFKEKIAQMSPEDKAAMLEQIQSKMPTGTQNQMQEHATEMQMEHSDDMNRAQNMNQQQAASQFGHDNEAAGGSFNRENVQNGAGTWTKVN
ncbi:hypothetical protein JHD46_03085 [Sulfurimonas sp. SAG-AH-194-C20]|nr:hypothetical protein [Sulfurimonas sp. SAG-AH-194-C20]MDF1878619.1 hypothetical protein [Sulfurimonas sp. SAG-AH-194-C20]